MDDTAAGDDDEEEDNDTAAPAADDAAAAIDGGGGDDEVSLPPGQTAGKEGCHCKTPSRTRRRSLAVASSSST